MQFVENGPDIPDSLLQLHEEGRVVFFCGAGISNPAGLPGFQGLVDKIFNITGTKRNAIEEESYTKGQFDTTLGLLERRLPGGRIAVRKALSDALKPNLRRKGATVTHKALLRLARHENALRLVTTNFDRIFEKADQKESIQLNSYAAPMLPIPKNSRWSGLVYLHGILPEKEDEQALNRLVLTSGDFGLAYLTEGWAARFVTELFRNYVVCFVGYSINDPVMRYMMDALAADRMLGEETLQAFTFGDCEPGEEEKKIIEWEAKGVTPILYENPAENHDHSLLHNTLKTWAETYRDGILGKERIVVDHALAHPSASTQQDDFISRMLWALSDPSGLPAKRFAEFNPVPSLAWLKIFSEDRYKQADLPRFDICSRTKTDEKLCFNFLRRPAPYTHAPRMALVSADGMADGRWDNVMYQMARWLVRHLNDPALVIWIAKHGNKLHSNWISLIENELNRFSRLERENKKEELKKIKSNAPNSIPTPLMQTIWRLLLTGRVKAWKNLDYKFYFERWEDRLKNSGLTATLRLELRELLSPKIVFIEPLFEGSFDTEPDKADQISALVRWELSLSKDRVYSFINYDGSMEWREILPLLINDFQQLLHDALDLLRELGSADNSSDRSHQDLPSITPHFQNRQYEEWTALIELTRDAWLKIREVNLTRATHIAKSWFDMPYPTFKRLALFAASLDGCVEPSKWIEWLLNEKARWLWAKDTQRETMRVLALQSAKLSSQMAAKLEKTILNGPPRDMFQEDKDHKEWDFFVNRNIWLRLAKLRQGGRSLGKIALKRFNELSELHPNWQLHPNEREEFSVWMYGTGDPGYEESRKIIIAPRKRKELVKWLKNSKPPEPPFSHDTWRGTCRTRFYHSLYALCDLTKEGLWPAERWRDALRVWSEEKIITRSWRFAAPLVCKMPDDVFQESVHSISHWLYVASKSTEHHETILLALCWRMLEMTYEENSGIDRLISSAINHSVGHVTEAVLNLWLKRKPNDNDPLPDDIEPFFTHLCDTNIKQFSHGRLILASRLVPLFRADRSWTEKYLLPLFDWKISPEEAKSAWKGFLWTPRLHRPLLKAFKPHLLDTVDHYVDLGDENRQLATFLTYAALGPTEGYTNKEFQDAFEKLPQKGLEKAAEALRQSLESSGDQREENWKNRIYPFWQNIWPKSIDLVSKNIANSLAQLSIAARGEFPNALSVVFGWLQPIEHLGFIVNKLNELGLCNRFPKDALRLLDAIINNQTHAPEKLRNCLISISNAEPELQKDQRFRKISGYLKRHGI